jgi:hypothetical protein
MTPVPPDPASPSPPDPEAHRPDPASSSPDRAFSTPDPEAASPDPASSTPDPAFSAPDRAFSTPDPASFLSGDAGDVTDPWRRTKRAVGELAFTALDALAGTRRRAARLARNTPRRDVLVIGVYRPGSSMPDALPSLHSQAHKVRIALGSTGEADASLREQTVAENLGGGKFENLNRVLAAAGTGERRPPKEGTVLPKGGVPTPEQDGREDTTPHRRGTHPAHSAGAPAQAPHWVLVVDDDVRLPREFLDRFVAVCEAFGLDLAQPAQTLRSHSAWKVTRRRPASLVRETRFVEIGPVTAFGRRAAAELLPFPALRYGWGLDLHWAALAGQRGWRLGVVDALPVRHESGLVAAAYSRDDAESEAASFLADRPYLASARANEVLAVHRRARS